MKPLIKILLLIVLLMYSCSIFSQTMPFNITNDFEVNIDYPVYLTYDNDIIWIYECQKSKIYKLDTSSQYTDTIEFDHPICGLDVMVDTLFLLKKRIQDDSIGTIYKLNHNSKEIFDSISWTIDPNIEDFEFLAVNEKFFFIYFFAGWSSRISLFERTGKKLNYIFDPGLGNPAGLTCNQDTLWYMASLGTDQKGMIWKHIVENEEIIQGADPFSLELPIIDPCGIASVNNMCFYVISKYTNKLYKIERKPFINHVLFDFKPVGELNIFPNPTTCGIKIDTQLDVERLEIYSIKGELLFNVLIETKDIQFNSIGAGYYILRFYTPNNEINKILIIN